MPEIAFLCLVAFDVVFTALSSVLVDSVVCDAGFVALVSVVFVLTVTV